MDDCCRIIKLSKEIEDNLIKALAKTPEPMYYDLTKSDHIVDCLRYYNLPVHPWAVVKLNTEKETKKMNARKCERCGKLYEVSEFLQDNEEIESARRNRVNTRFRFDEIYPKTLAGLSDQGIAERQLDLINIKRQCEDRDVTLCPDCLASLKKWFEEG